MCCFTEVFTIMDEDHFLGWAVLWRRKVRFTGIEVPSQSQQMRELGLTYFYPTLQVQKSHKPQRALLRAGLLGTQWGGD